MAVAIIFMGVASPLFTRRMEACDEICCEQMKPRAERGARPRLRRLRQYTPPPCLRAAMAKLQRLECRRISDTRRCNRESDSRRSSRESPPACAGDRAVRLRHYRDGGRTRSLAPRKQKALAWLALDCWAPCARWHAVRFVSQRSRVSAYSGADSATTRSAFSCTWW